MSIRTWPSRAFSTGAAVLILALPPLSAHADGEFWAIDVSESTRSGVLSASRGELTFGANVTDDGHGVSASLSLTRRISVRLRH